MIFYIALIRPQQKKAKEHAELLKNVRAGDKIVTNGGMVGVVVTVKENTLTLRSADPSWKSSSPPCRNHRAQRRPVRILILISTMTRNFYWKLTIVVLALVWSLYELYPPTGGTSPSVSETGGPARRGLHEHRPAVAGVAAHEPGPPVRQSARRHRHQRHRPLFPVFSEAKTEVDPTRYILNRCSARPPAGSSWASTCRAAPPSSWRWTPTSWR